MPGKRIRMGALRPRRSSRSTSFLRSMARAGSLAASAFDQLAAIEGVTVITPRHAMGTLVAFRIAGWTADAAVAELGARAFAIVRSVPGDAIRISVGFWNTPDELARFARVVELLATQTPERLPPRRTLPILEGA